ncbi:MAG TPA: 23S rRNA (uracil(1939)-C(5))-methyltransferase RlmD [Burkholderiales bacterium]
MMSTLVIESLDHEGHGVARTGGKVVFVDGALPGEEVTIRTLRRKPSFDSAEVQAVLRESSFRVAPRCPYFGKCGGCSLQHLDPTAQVAAKQRILEDNLWHIGRVRPEAMLRAVYGQPWEYRHRARLSVRYVAKKGGTLVGFHEKRSSYVVDMRSCAVLPRRISDLVAPLRDLVDRLSIRERLPQIEVACGERVDVLVLRVLAPPSPADEAQLRSFADAHSVQLWLQPGGPDSACPFHPLDAPQLDYRLPESGISLPFRPTEFTQVNLPLNRILVRRALQVLRPRPGERIADFFCGLGNFALAVARSGASVVGYEASVALLDRAESNARHNGLEEAVAFVVADLFQATPGWIEGQGYFDKWLVDPPRDGAVELVKAIPDREAAAPRRVAYVSCNPATLARDAGILVHVKGYRLEAAGVINMFPHTSHVESVALFERS